MNPDRNIFVNKQSNKENVAKNELWRKFWTLTLYLACVSCIHGMVRELEILTNLFITEKTAIHAKFLLTILILTFRNIIYKDVIL